MRYGRLILPISRWIKGLCIWWRYSIGIVVNVITWEVSNNLGGQFCLDALHHALCKATPTIFNTDQGVQFTANAFTDTVEAAGSAMSMDGVGRAIDNIYIERFWRSIKYEDVYQKLYPTAKALFDGLTHYIRFYNYKRPHQSLNYATPAEVYQS